MPRRQPLPLTFIIRAVNRYSVNARADRFESFLLFRSIDSIVIFVIITGGEPSRCPSRVPAFMPRHQPLPLSIFIDRAVNRYHVNARGDQFESFLVFRFR